MNEQMKALSVGDLEGLECRKRHLAERYLGYRVESEAMKYGIQVHDIARQINEQRRLKEEEPTQESIRAMIGASSLSLSQKAGKDMAEVALLWWAERTSGTRPIDVEKPRFVQLGDWVWVFKPDAARLDARGHLRIDDYKTGQVGSKEVARRNPRFMAYAVFGRDFYGYSQVHTNVWNFGQQYSIDIEWEEDELERTKAYLAVEAAKIGRMHDQLMATPEDQWPSLLDSDEFPERLNDYCGSCPLGKLGKCATLKRLMLEQALPEAEDEAHRLDILRTAQRVIRSLLDPMEEVVKAHVIEMGERIVDTKTDGRLVGYHRLAYGDREALVKVEKHLLKEFKEQAELQNDILRLGKRTEMKARRVKWAVYTLALGSGMIATYKVPVKQEKKVIRESKIRQTQRLMVRRVGI